jgi:hypothetical protein
MHSVNEKENIHNLLTTLQIFHSSNFFFFGWREKEKKI